MKARWRPSARADRLAIIDYIAQRNVEAALQTDERIMSSVRLLEHHPFAGRAGRMTGTRELIITSTRLVAIYRVVGETPVIVRLLHMARDWPPAGA